MRYAILFPVTVILAFPIAVHAGDLVLQVSPSAVSVKRGEQLKVQATIANHTSGIVTLVQPGDGSEVGWRTPIIGWSVLPVDSKKQHPLAPPPDPRRFCGNINPLTRSQVFALQPTESKTLAEWISPPTDLPLGEYRAIFYFRNDPKKKMEGVPLGENEPGVNELVAGSTPCNLVSNEIRVKIVPHDLVSRPPDGQ